MATLLHFPPTFLSLSPHKLYSSPLPSLRNAPHNSKIYHCLPTIYASSRKKPRVRKKVRSNEDLCSDIREFMSEFGFEEGQLPSFKEFSQHGRQDLANIVRRRGYKLVKELLVTPADTNIYGDNIEKESTERQDTAVNRNQQDEKVNDMADDVNLSRESPIIEDDSNRLDISSDVNLDDKSRIYVVESATKSSLQEKVARFIQNGELNMIEDSGFDILDESVAEEGKGFDELENPTELESSSVSEEQGDHVLCGGDSAKVLNGNGTSRNNYSSTDGLSSADCTNDLDVETRKKENDVEISRLKFMLHQKELELSELKQQIEKEKLALSVLQTKAETEMRKVRKLNSEKDSELHAAEEVLSGLEEVQVEYWGGGESVEVAGSFNGWHQRIKMDPQPSSSITDPRKSRIWRTVLWLYPGTYEIKFIVDGHWMIDPQRESVTKGTIQNNILRVHR